MITAPLERWNQNLTVCNGGGGFVVVQLPTGDTHRAAGTDAEDRVVIAVFVVTVFVRRGLLRCHIHPLHFAILGKYTAFVLTTPQRRNTTWEDSRGR